MQLSDPISPLDAHLGYWLRFVSNHVSHSFALKVAGRGVTVAEWVMLRELWENQTIAPSSLAESLGLTRGAVSKLAERLVTKKMVTRVSSLADRRYQTVALTAKGRELVPILAALADANDKTYFGHLTPAERAALTITLQTIVSRQGLKGTPID